jgi:tetratricopeptide (TPR) repeat protein
MTDTENKAKGPGQRGRGDRGGFSFGDRKESGRGRDRRDGPGGGGASYRIINELSALEKALTKSDFAAMKEPLAAVLRAVKPLRLSSIEQMDMNTRGRLITSLMRVMRLPKPPPGEAIAPAESSPANAPAAEAAAAAPEGAEVGAEVPPAEAPQSAPPPAPVDPRLGAWAEAQFTIGLIWAAVNEGERAAAAFEAAGRQPTEAELAAPPQAERPARDERPERGPRKDRRERQERAPRQERGARPERTPFVSSGDWVADAGRLEGLGRTRDAARLHEKHQSYAEAARLFEAGGDLKSALRNAALGNLDEAFTSLSARLKPEEVVEALERAQRWEKLMELHVARGDFEAIAKLYERAGQFDQAALAWEKAGRLSFARKSYERVKDFAAANRVRELEVAKLIERGDRLGAATLLLGANKRAEAVEVVKALPGPKAYHFLQKLKLNAEAEALAAAELAKADAAGKPLDRARWLELTGKLAEAADAYLAADRKDKAAWVFEQLGHLARAAELLEAAGLLDKAQKVYEKAGDVANVERVKALPRPEPRPSAAAAAEAPVVPPPEAVPTAPSAQA